MRQPSPGHTSYSDIKTDIDRGNIKIPQFQREYVWSKKQAAMLMDSIIKGYPIGTFIMWKTKERLRSIRNIGNISLPEIPEGDFVLYVLDGQQRITSLYASIIGASIDRNNKKHEAFSEIYIDLVADTNSEKDIVVVEKEVREDNSYISICDLTSQNIGKLVNEYSLYIDKIDDYKNKLHNYQFPTVTIQDAPINVATEIFTRLNVGGKTLTVFEIMCAKVYDHKANFDLAEKYDELTELWSQYSYDTIPSSTVLQTVSVCLTDDCSKKQILNLPKNDFIDIWSDATTAINSAIDYFKSYYRIPVSRLLPYNGLLVVFSYYFYKHKDKPIGEQQKYLEDLFWRITLSSRYTSSLETKIAQDINRVNYILEDKKPIYDYSVDISYETLVQSGWFSTGKAYIKGFLCILASKEPKSFVDGSKVNVDNDWLKIASSKNYHHFFPKAYLKKQGEEESLINHIANITIVDDFLNKRLILDKAPSKYMQGFIENNNDLDVTMKSHLINDLESFGVTADDYDAFFKARIEAFQEELKKRLILTNLDRI